MLLLQADCDTRKCCWVGDDVNMGSCYHRLPSPYSLSLTSASQVGFNLQTSVPDPDPNPDQHFFWASRIRIRIHLVRDVDPDPSIILLYIIKQNSKENLDSYCFVTSESISQSHGFEDPGIRIRTKMSCIRNTGSNHGGTLRTKHCRLCINCYGTRPKGGYSNSSPTPSTHTHNHPGFVIMKRRQCIVLQVPPWFKRKF
jgi:hypothetical protein